MRPWFSSHYFLYFFLPQNNGLEKFMFPKDESPKVSKQKEIP